MSEYEFTFYWNQFEKLYRKLARQWHPDYQPAERQAIATRRMQWLNALRDEIKALGG